MKFKILPFISIIICLFLNIGLASAICATTHFNSANHGICDSYNAGTDTCTITTTHAYTGGAGCIHYYGSNIVLTFTNIALSGEINVNGGLFTPPGGHYGGNGGTITINAVALTGSGMIKADGHDGGDGGGHAGTITISADTVDVSLISANGGVCSSVDHGGDGGTITIDSDTLDVGSISANGGSSGFGPSDGVGGAVTINAITFTSTGTISMTGADSAPDGPLSMETYEIKLTGNVDSGGIKIRYCEELPGNDFNLVVGTIYEDIAASGVITCLALYERHIQTFLSLQGTVTDTTSAPIDGMVTVTSLERCKDISCTTKTSVSIAGATNDVSVITGKANGMIGPYDLVLGSIHILTVKVCDMFGLCDTDIKIKFTA